MDIVLILSVLAIACWLPFVITTFIVVRSLRNVRDYERPLPRGTRNPEPRLLFRFMTRGGTAELVNAGLQSVVDACSAEGFTAYTMDVFTEDDADVFDPRATTYVVPKGFRTPNASRFKARALCYSLVRTKASDSLWIFHLDEESRVTRQCVAAMLDYIRRGGQPVAEGPINYPIEFGRSWLASFMESSRAGGCLFCIDQIEDGPMLWFHGSNLLVRSDVETAVGWDYGPLCLGEDERFAIEARRHVGPDGFGWHGGLVLEQPAFSVRDAMRQRQRWFIGGVRNLRHFTPALRIMKGLFLSSAILGFPGFLLGSLGWVGLIRIPPLIGVLLLFSTVVWFSQIQLGLHYNLRHLGKSRRARLVLHLACLALTPLLGVLEGLPAFFALWRRPKTFEVIRKVRPPAKPIPQPPVVSAPASSE